MTIRRTIITASAAALALTMPLRLSGQTDDDPIVVIHSLVPADYKDDEASLKELHVTLARAPLRQVNVKPREDVSQIISREFNFGRSNHFVNSVLNKNVPLTKAYTAVAEVI